MPTPNLRIVRSKFFPSTHPNPVPSGWGAVPRMGQPNQWPERRLLPLRWNIIVSRLTKLNAACYWVGSVLSCPPLQALARPLQAPPTTTELASPFTASHAGDAPQAWLCSVQSCWLLLSSHHVVLISLSFCDYQLVSLIKPWAVVHDAGLERSQGAFLATCC